MPNTEKFTIDAALVHRLIALQFPQWKNLPIKPVEFGGWDNRTFHLGERMTVRLPSDAEYAPSVEKEQCWLPKLKVLLPLPIPTPLALGMPTEEYPWHWSIYQWLDGETATKGNINDLSQFAMDLAQFLTAFQKIDASDGPHNFYRGSAFLSMYDAETRQAIALLDNKIDTEAATALWNMALASTWKNAPVWFHGDVAVGNMLVQNGQLSAIIDFGSIGVGDPACDLAIAWTLFKGESREVFLANLPLDNATWERGRGWALWKALIVCAELPGTNPLEIEKSWLVVNEVLAEYKRKESAIDFLSKVGSPEITRHLSFRDFMRQHENYSKAYSVLKRCLAEVFPHDIENYVKGKSSFVQMIDYKTGAARDKQLKAQDNIIIEPYNSAWPKLATAEIKAIKIITHLLPFVLIEHIGSTAVPDLSSKPIIDIFITIPSIKEAVHWIAPLESLGYLYWEENPDKEHLRFFKGMPPFGEGRTHHVHIVESSNSTMEHRLLFRDILRRDKQIRLDYESLKLKLAQSHLTDRELYTDSKLVFIESTLRAHGYNMPVTR